MLKVSSSNYWKYTRNGSLIEKLFQSIHHKRKELFEFQSIVIKDYHLLIQYQIQSTYDPLEKESWILIVPRTSNDLHSTIDSLTSNPEISYEQFASEILLSLPYSFVLCLDVTLMYLDIHSSSSSKHHLIAITSEGIVLIWSYSQPQETWNLLGQHHLIPPSNPVKTTLSPVDESLIPVTLWKVWVDHSIHRIIWVQKGLWKEDSWETLVQGEAFPLLDSTKQPQYPPINTTIPTLSEDTSPSSSSSIYRYYRISYASIDSFQEHSYNISPCIHMFLLSSPHLTNVIYSSISKTIFIFPQLLQFSQESVDLDPLPLIFSYSFQQLYKQQHRFLISYQTIESIAVYPWTATLSDYLLCDQTFLCQLPSTSSSAATSLEYIYYELPTILQHSYHNREISSMIILLDTSTTICFACLFPNNSKLILFWCSKGQRKERTKEFTSSFKKEKQEVERYEYSHIIPLFAIAKYEIIYKPWTGSSTFNPSFVTSLTSTSYGLPKSHTMGRWPLLITPTSFLDLDFSAFIQSKSLTSHHHLQDFTWLLEQYFSTNNPFILSIVDVNHSYDSDRRFTLDILNNVSDSEEQKEFQEVNNSCFQKRFEEIFPSLYSLIEPSNTSLSSSTSVLLPSSSTNQTTSLSLNVRLLPPKISSQELTSRGLTLYQSISKNKSNYNKNKLFCEWKKHDAYSWIEDILSTSTPSTLMDHLYNSARFSYSSKLMEYLTNHLPEITITPSEDYTLLAKDKDIFDFLSTEIGPWELLTLLQSICDIILQDTNELTHIQPDITPAIDSLEEEPIKQHKLSRLNASDDSFDNGIFRDVESEEDESEDDMIGPLDNLDANHYDSIGFEIPMEIFPGKRSFEDILLAHETLLQSFANFKPTTINNNSSHSPTQPLLPLIGLFAISNDQQMLFPVFNFLVMSLSKLFQPFALNKLLHVLPTTDPLTTIHLNKPVELSSFTPKSPKPLVSLSSLLNDDAEEGSSHGNIIPDTDSVFSHDKQIIEHDKHSQDQHAFSFKDRHFSHRSLTQPEEEDYQLFDSNDHLTLEDNQHIQLFKSQRQTMISFLYQHLSHAVYSTQQITHWTSNQWQQFLQLCLSLNDLPLYFSIINNVLPENHLSMILSQCQSLIIHANSLVLRCHKSPVFDPLLRSHLLEHKYSSYYTLSQVQTSSHLSGCIDMSHIDQLWNDYFLSFPSDGSLPLRRRRRSSLGPSESHVYVPSVSNSASLFSHSMDLVLESKETNEEKEDELFFEPCYVLPKQEQACLCFVFILRLLLRSSLGLIDEKLIALIIVWIQLKPPLMNKDSLHRILESEPGHIKLISLSPQYQQFCK